MTKLISTISADPLRGFAIEGFGISGLVAVVWVGLPIIAFLPPVAVCGLGFYALAHKH